MARKERVYRRQVREFPHAVDIPCDYLYATVRTELGPTELNTG